VPKSTGTLTVILDLLVQDGLVLQYSSFTHVFNLNPNPKLTLTLNIIHNWSNYARVFYANSDGLGHFSFIIVIF